MARRKMVRKGRRQAFASRLSKFAESTGVKRSGYLATLPTVSVSSIQYTRIRASVFVDASETPLHIVAIPEYPFDLAWVVGKGSYPDGVSTLSINASMRLIGEYAASKICHVNIVGQNLLPAWKYGLVAIKSVTSYIQDGHGIDSYNRTLEATTSVDRGTNGLGTSAHVDRVINKISYSKVSVPELQWYKISDSDSITEPTIRTDFRLLNSVKKTALDKQDYYEVGVIDYVFAYSYNYAEGVHSENPVTATTRAIHTREKQQSYVKGNKKDVNDSILARVMAATTIATPTTTPR